MNRIVRTACILAVALTLIACRGGVSPNTYLDAVYEGDTETVAAALEAGIAVDTELPLVELPDYTNEVQGFTALMVAVRYEHIAIVNQLIEAGADVNVRAFGNVTPLMVAAGIGNAEIVEALIDAGGDIAAEDDNGVDALGLAAELGKVDVAEVLLGAGAEVDARQRDGATAMMNAAVNGHREVVGTLITAGADPNAMAEEPEVTALMNLAGSGANVEMVRFLIDQGADPDFRNSDNISALVNAVQNQNTDIVQFLLTTGVNVNVEYWNQEDHQHQTPLIFAAATGQENVVEALIGAGAELDKMTDEGAFALYAAAQYGNANVARALINSGGNPDQRNQYNESALYIAADQGYSDIVRLLLDRGAELNVVTVDGHTAFFGAVLFGHTEVVRILLDRGANPNIVEVVDRESVTALEYAARQNHYEIADLLRQYGATE